MCLSSCLCALQQDMGQDIEPYFQEVLATLEQSMEEGSRGEGGALKDRLLQLYSKIVTSAESGRISLQRKYKTMPDHISTGQS